MSKRLEGKVAVVTGGNSGSGRATALAFAREGARVVIGARRVEEGEAVVREIESAGGEAVFVATDVTDAAQTEALVAEAVERFGGLDIAFNNAGMEGTGLRTLAEDDADNVRSLLEVNVLGVWNAMKAELPELTRRGGGVIINTSSVAGQRGFGAFSGYVASKFAVEGLSRSVAQEVAAAGIRVNTVAPGPIATDLFARTTGGDADLFVSHVPAGRAGRPEEVADAVVFLASAESRYVTSQALVVDGGMLA